jgi:hypothetical protein
MFPEEYCGCMQFIFIILHTDRGMKVSTKHIVNTLV